MGFSSSAPQSRESIIGSVVWNQKKIPNLVTPNIRFYDKDKKEETHLIAAGEIGQAQVSGVLAKVSVGQVPSYNDRLKDTGESNQWRVYATLDSGPDEPLAVLGFDVYDASTQRVSPEGLALVNSLATHAQLVIENKLQAELPVQIGFYRSTDKQDNTKSYANSVIRMPSGANEDGTYEFRDPKNIIRSAEMPPRGEPVMVPDSNGNMAHLEVNGIKAYNYTAAIQWLEGKLGLLTEHYKRSDVEAPVDTAPAESMEDEADLAGAVDAVTEDQTTRQRMAG